MDGTMCEGKVFIPEYGLVRVCVKRQQCYRHTATANQYMQSYFVSAPLTYVGGEQHCEEFVPNS